MSEFKDGQASRYHQAKQWEIAFFSLNNSATNLYLFAFGFLTYYATGIAGFATLLVSNLLGAARLFDGLLTQQSVLLWINSIHDGGNSDH